jgi:hypothetical protein
MKRRMKNLLLAAITVLGMETAAHAAPFVDVTVLGSPNGTSNWSANLTVTPGETVYYEVNAIVAGANTSNTQSGKTFVLGTQTSGSDGISSLALALSDTLGTTLSPTLASAWSGITGAGPTTGGYKVGPAVGSYNGLTTSTIMTGSFTFSQSATSDTLSAGNDTQLTGTTGGMEALLSSGFTKSPQTPIQITATSESGADPYVGYTPLALSEAPEPSSVGLLLLGIPFLARRRRQA